MKVLDTKHRLFGLVGAAGCMWAGCASAGTTYSAFSDYSDANPSGVWTYLSAGSPLADFSEDWLGISGLWDWSTQGTASCTLAQIDANETTGTLAVLTANLPPATLLLDPETTSDATLRFTAPTAGSYSVHATFTGIDVNQRAHAVSISHNGTVVTASSINNYNESLSSSQTISLAVDDTVDFIVHGSSGCSYLSTGLTATIVGP